MGDPRPLGRRPALVRMLTLGLVTVVGFVVAWPGGPRAAQSVAFPNAIVVMGHSGATGYDSNPLHPGVDARANSWATGTNPAVNSIYRRILARNPAINGHTFNVAESGSDVNALMRQARSAVSSRPIPDLFVIQSVDNDIQCDGTDAQNYAPFAATLQRTLEFINQRAPKAHIFMVSQWATVKNYTNVIKTIPAERAAESGTGPCSGFDPSGRPRRKGMA